MREGSPWGSLWMRPSKIGRFSVKVIKTMHTRVTKNLIGKMLGRSVHPNTSNDHS